MVELIGVEGRRLSFKATCRDEAGVIGSGFHERAVIVREDFMSRIARKSRAWAEENKSPAAGSPMEPQDSKPGS